MIHLINVETMQLEEFTSERDREYTILSHRWQKDEVLYEDMRDLAACTKTGKRKLTEFCNLVRRSGIKYAWVDTCCIDKKSSAELSESINSMYKYYSFAHICVVYLYDVEASRPEDPKFTKQFGKSVWFTRSWTLQELVAPRSVEFYNAHWQYVSDLRNLAAAISSITSIDEDALTGSSLSNYSIAKRMSWACDRCATRTEDIAYSLMGIFDVNMPMLYGEGEKAFQRLQEEILRHSTDETIFAWSGKNMLPASSPIGPLAPSPAYFRGCQRLQSTQLHERDDGHEMTNRGLLMNVGVSRSGNIHIAFLNASYVQDDNNKLSAPTEEFVGLRLVPGRQSGYGRLPELWKGSLAQVIALDQTSGQITIKNGDSHESHPPQPFYGFAFSIRSVYAAQPSSQAHRVTTRARLGAGQPLVEPDENLIMGHESGQTGYYGELTLSKGFSTFAHIGIGISKDRRPVCTIVYLSNHVDRCYNDYDRYYFYDKGVPLSELGPNCGTVNGDTYVVGPSLEGCPMVLAMAGFYSRRTTFLCPTWTNEAYDFERTLEIDLTPRFDRLNHIWKLEIKDVADAGPSPTPNRPEDFGFEMTRVQARPDDINNLEISENRDEGMLPIMNRVRDLGFDLAKARTQSDDSTRLVRHSARPQRAAPSSSARYPDP